jgi:hypothetical protein
MFIHPQILVELAKIRQRELDAAARGRRPRRAPRHQRNDR